LQKEVAKARNYAFRLFKFRPRAEKELIRRLRERKFIQPVINKIISEFKDQALIDDTRFVQDWTEVRRKKGFSWERIKFELKQKGIEEELLEDSVCSGDEDYFFALEVAKKQKSLIMKKGVDVNKIKQRLFNFMIHRGFTPDTSREIIQDLL